MLSLASSKLEAGEFDQIAGLIPGADGYLSAAKSMVGNVNNVAELNGAFSDLGISTDQAAKLVPAVTDFVGEAGGDSAGDLLSGLFK
jgi:hypothetical protein